MNGFDGDRSHYREILQAAFDPLINAYAISAPDRQGGAQTGRVKNHMGLIRIDKSYIASDMAVNFLDFEINFIASVRLRWLLGRKLIVS